MFPEARVNRVKGAERSGKTTAMGALDLATRRSPTGDISHCSVCDVVETETSTQCIEIVGRKELERMRCNISVWLERDTSERMLWERGRNVGNHVLC